MTYILQYVLFSSGETTKPQNVLGNTLRTHLKMNESFCPLFILLKNSVALSIVPKLFSSYSFAFIEYTHFEEYKTEILERISASVFSTPPSL